MTSDTANSSLSLLIRSIVSDQRSIIGPLAITQANKVPGIHISSDLTSIETTGESKKLLSDLVSQYEHLFGKASVEACKESIRNLLSKIPATDLPEVLR